MKKKKMIKYLYLLPIVVCLGFVIYFNQLTQHIRHEEHERLFTNRKDMLNLASTEINYFLHYHDNWDEERDFYIDWLLFSRDFANAQEFTISVLMDQDFNLVYNDFHLKESSHYEFFLSQDFITTVEMTGSGEMVLPFDGEKISVYYRWMPEREGQEEQFLLAVGVTQNSSRDPDNVFIPAIASLIIFVLLVNYIMLWTILKKKGDEKL